MGKSESSHIFSNLNVSWLSDEAQSPKQAIDSSIEISQFDYALPAHIGTAHATIMQTRDNISIYKAEHHYHADQSNPEHHHYPIVKGELTLDETGFFAMFSEREVVQVDKTMTPDTHRYGMGTGHFRRTHQLSIEAFHNVTQPFNFISFSLGDSMLTKLIGVELQERLYERLGLSQPPAATVVPVPYAHTQPLFEAVTNDYSGRLQELYIHGKILEFISAFANYYLEENRLTLQNSDRHLISELHQQLLVLEGKLPSIADLAERYGMSPKKLNTLFKQCYGQPIHSFILQRRLEEAHALIADSETPLKLIAHRLGYSHQNHFITAFKRQFGYPPGHLRNRREPG
ncbi:MAG: helix-turn-helix transcriptional regulator [Gammaproteobacteria bacterium]|nr:helix-turn-helix transcriptional regulator [Gammaproteobacteria bacterium]